MIESEFDDCYDPYTPRVSSYLEEVGLTVYDAEYLRPEYVAFMEERIKQGITYNDAFQQWTNRKRTLEV